MYADPYDPEDRTFPFGPAAAAVFVILGALLFAFAGGKPRDPPSPTYPMLGCYSSTGAPDLLFDKSSVTVMQTPAVKIRSSLKYNKGWAFDVDRNLAYHQDTDGKIEIHRGSPPGEYLFIVQEGQFAPEIPGFELPNDTGKFVIRYSRSGNACAPN